MYTRALKITSSSSEKVALHLAPACPRRCPCHISLPAGGARTRPLSLCLSPAASAELPSTAKGRISPDIATFPRSRPFSSPTQESHSRPPTCRPWHRNGEADSRVQSMLRSYRAISILPLICTAVWREAEDVLFSQEENEAQEGQVACSGSPSQEVSVGRSEPRSPSPNSLALNLRAPSL